ncbi:fungal specific transcription factor domain-containing protein, partial [Candidatus Bathyarchaeota archaeon]|nr:fungal specific transcription factor domain-containing protein [Candidatus Bathyarchaeota archaeon]
MNLTYDGIIERYFTSGFHTSFPIISPDSLRHEASQYREGRLPPADFTVLLLAILLIISPPLDYSRHRITQEFLYTTTKAAFSQAQTSITTSLRLLQAAVLITLREYTCARVDAAY